MLTAGLIAGGALIGFAILITVLSGSSRRSRAGSSSDSVAYMSDGGADCGDGGSDGSCGDGGGGGGD